MKDDIIRMAREAGSYEKYEVLYFTIDDLERFTALVRADERKQFPDLTAVITWLDNGCDPKEAAKELRLYAAAIRARGQDQASASPQPEPISVTCRHEWFRTGAMEPGKCRCIYCGKWSVIKPC